MVREDERGRARRGRERKRGEESVEESLLQHERGSQKLREDDVLTSGVESEEGEVFRGR